MILTIVLTYDQLWRNRIEQACQGVDVNLLGSSSAELVEKQNCLRDIGLQKLN